MNSITSTAMSKYVFVSTIINFKTMVLTNKSMRQDRDTLRNPLFIVLKKRTLNEYSRLKTPKSYSKQSSTELQKWDFLILYFTILHLQENELAFFLSFYKLCKNLKTQNSEQIVTLKKNPKQKNKHELYFMSPSLLLYT